MILRSVFGNEVDRMYKALARGKVFKFNQYQLVDLRAWTLLQCSCQESCKL
jgi:hypothetical protein